MRDPGIQPTPDLCDTITQFVPKDTAACLRASSSRLQVMSNTLAPRRIALVTGAGSGIGRGGESRLTTSRLLSRTYRSSLARAGPNGRDVPRQRAADARDFPLTSRLLPKFSGCLTQFARSSAASTYCSTTRARMHPHYLSTRLRTNSGIRWWA